MLHASEAIARQLDDLPASVDDWIAKESSKEHLPVNVGDAEILKKEHIDE